MASRSKTVDWGGMSVIVDEIRLATKPGQYGSASTLTGTEVALLDGLTAGTVTASKALVVDADKALSTLGAVGMAALTATTGTFSGALTATGGLRLAPVAIADASSYAVLTANSGKTHAVPDVTADITVTLPAAASGLTYKFIYGGAAADAQNHIFVPTAGFYIGGVTFHDSQADATTAVYSDGNSNDVFTLVTPAAYVLEFTSNGTNWYVSGFVQSATVCTMAD
jgi:hypothetical protein